MGYLYHIHKKSDLQSSIGAMRGGISRHEKNGETLEIVHIMLDMLNKN